MSLRPPTLCPETSPSTLKEIRQLGKSATSIYLATDPDREGEAISWHLAKALGWDLDSPALQRIVFHEITPGAIQEAFQHTRPLDLDLVNAQQARRILDRLVGYELSPLLWSKVQRGLSAGRVQSVALRQIVDREKEIQAFKPREYWDYGSKSGQGRPQLHRPPPLRGRRTPEDTTCQRSQSAGD